MAELLILDGNNLLMRSIHAMYGKTLSSDNGVPTGPLMAFINSVSHAIKKTDAKRVVVCWDGGHSDRRLILSDTYKANRNQAEGQFAEWKDSSFSLAHEFLNVAGIEQRMVKGIEADDLVAHVWRHRDPMKRTVIVSNDKDFLQLLEPGVLQMRVSSSNTETDVWDYRRVEEDMGVTPLDMPYYLALVGDTSDNVAGVPRVGPKTAIKIITECEGVWSEILRHPKVEPHTEAAQIALQQVDLRTEYEQIGLPTEVSPRPTSEQINNTAVYAFLDRYGLEQIKGRIMSGSFLTSTE